MKRYAQGFLACMTGWIIAAAPAAAHNESIHQAMTDLSWQMMRFVEQTGTARISETDPEFIAFLERVKTTPHKYLTRPSQLHELVAADSSGCAPPLQNWNTSLGGLRAAPKWDFYKWKQCGSHNADWEASLAGVAPDDFIGAALGFWAGSPDGAYDDTHLWFRPSNALGLGAVREVANEATEDALTVALVPIVCLIDWLFGDGEDCVKDSKKIADTVDVTEEIDGWIPGIGDVHGESWVGVWHFIDMNDGASNEYDERQGKLWDEAGVPGAPMDALELVLMAGFDAAGLSVNFSDSQGIGKYTVDNANDGVQDTIRRDQAKWQFTSIAHTPFEPVNNLAWHGWSRFHSDSAHPVSMLAWPLHAIGDSIAPMHVVGTSAWGHRPFEDSQERIWPGIWNFRKNDVQTQLPAIERTMRRAFEWWKVIEGWRASHGNTKDIPIRQLIRELAARTHAYSMQQHAATLGDWPFSPAASTTYLVAENDSIQAYADTDGAAEKVRPLYEDGMGMTIAVLVAAGEHFE